MLAVCRLPNLRYELGHVAITFCQQILPAQLGSYGLLQKLGRGQPTRLDQFVKIVGQIQLHSWHTPKYTP